MASTQRTFSLESSYSDLYLRKKAHKHKLFVSKSNKNLYLNTKNLNENPVKENISSFNNTERLHYSKNSKNDEGNLKFYKKNNAKTENKLQSIVKEYKSLFPVSIPVGYQYGYSDDFYKKAKPMLNYKSFSLRK